MVMGKGSVVANTWSESQTEAAVKVNVLGVRMPGAPEGQQHTKVD